MIYQCVYCKASYEHEKSYAHNSYECPKVRKKVKAGIAVVLVTCMLSVTGCEALKGLLPKETLPEQANRAELQVYVGNKAYKYVCGINPETKVLADCVEVQ